MGELLQALAVHLQRVLVGEAADSLDFYGGFGFAASHNKRFLPNQLEHPVFSDDFLWAVAFDIIIRNKCFNPSSGVPSFLNSANLSKANDYMLVQAQGCESGDEIMHSFWHFFVSFVNFDLTCPLTQTSLFPVVVPWENWIL